MAAPRIVIVGAGPAGIRAAETLVSAGLRPVLLDESQASGGQIYRRQPAGFLRTAATLYGTEAARATSIHAAFDALESSIEYHPQTLAWNIEPGVLHGVRDNRAQSWPFDALILACGATDRLLPMQGWTLPGVYSLGAAQIALKAQACAIGRRVVFAGTGPLLYLVAAQYVKAGAQVAAIFDTSSRWDQVRAMPLLAARMDNLLKGAALLWRLRRAGVPVYRGVMPIALEDGTTTEGGEGISAVSVRLASGSELRMECDAVALGYHLRAETQLADLAGCRFEYDRDSGQWLPWIDRDGRSSVANIYLAGDGVRILGADGAENAGRIAAMAVLADHGMPVSARDLSSLHRAQRRMDRFRKGLAVAFPWPARLVGALQDDALVCRCEAITVGNLRQSARALGAPEVNRAKAFSRVGMGRCQGRYCGLASAEILAEALATDVVGVGRLRGQAPIKPLPIATRVDPA